MKIRVNLHKVYTCDKIEPITFGIIVSKRCVDLLNEWTSHLEKWHEIIYKVYSPSKKEGMIITCRCIDNTDMISPTFTIGFGNLGDMKIIEYSIKNEDKSGKTFVLNFPKYNDLVVTNLNKEADKRLNKI